MLFAHPYIEHWNTYPTFQLHTNKHHHFQQQPSHFISQSQVSGKYCSCFHSDELLYVAKQSKHLSGHGSHIQPAGWVTTAVAGVMTLHCTVRRRDKCHRDSVRMSRLSLPLRRGQLTMCGSLSPLPPATDCCVFTAQVVML